MRTIEEKAKRYDEIIEKANKMHSENCEACQMCIEELIPELKESEDEKIIQFLIHEVKETSDEIMSYRGMNKEAVLAWLEKQQKPIKEHDVCDFCDEKHGCVSPCPTKLIEEQKTGDFSDLRTWKYIVDAVRTEKEGIGQYLDSPFTEEIAKKLQKRFGNIEQKLAWSEEDERMLDTVIEDIIKLAGPYVCYHKDVDWLKSLRPQSHWKPSELQIEALESATENCAYSEYQDCLRELIGQLKKLKE